MSILETFLQNRRDFISRNKDPILQENCIGSKQMFDALHCHFQFKDQKRPKRSLIKINSRKFPNGFFQSNEISQIKPKIIKFKGLKGNFVNVDLMNKRSMSLDCQKKPKQQEEFRRTSFFKYSQDILNRNNQNIQQKCSRKSSLNSRGKWTADKARQLNIKRSLPKMKTQKQNVFNCTFSQNISKELSTEAQSPTYHTMQKKPTNNDKSNQTTSFKLINDNDILNYQGTIVMTERTDYQMKCYRKRNISKPLQLPMINFGTNI